MPDTKTFTGGCHCGRVRFEAAIDLGNVISCNCSICQKRGLLLSFLPAAEFKLQSGDDAQTDYRFNKMQIAHAFCSTCGIESFARGRMPSGAEMVGINVRCLDDVDVAALTPKLVNGREF